MLVANKEKADNPTLRLLFRKVRNKWVSRDIKLAEAGRDSEELKARLEVLPPGHPPGRGPTK
jgi:hypothetical protein